jgi:hypothetical protein
MGYVVALRGHQKFFLRVVFLKGGCLMTGYDTQNALYDEVCAQVDEFTFEHPDLLPIFAAGNEGLCFSFSLCICVRAGECFDEISGRGDGFFHTGFAVDF